MASIKYHYNSDTCQYEKITFSKKSWVIRLGAFGVTILGMASFLFFFHSRRTPSSKAIALLNHNTTLKLHQETLRVAVGNLQQSLQLVREKGDKVHKRIFNIVPSTIHPGISTSLQSRIGNKEAPFMALSNRLNWLKGQLLIQATSYEHTLNMAHTKAKQLATIPSRQPIDNPMLDRLVAGFGRCYQPILKIHRMHAGLDFLAPKGTPVYATGNGVINCAKKGYNRGAGNYLTIRHSHGFRTRYNHLKNFHVKVGQRVTRGQKIGSVGNTGSSFAPHLHYEVIKHGKKVNPIPYCFQGLTAAAYEKLMALAATNNQSLD